MATKKVKGVKAPTKAQVALKKFMAESEARGPMTIHDHLIESGFTGDYNDYRSMRAATSRALASNPLYQDRRGLVFLVEKRKGAGIQPQWAAGLPVHESRHPMPDFLGSTAMVVVKDALRHIDDPEANARAIEGMTQLARLSRKAQNAAMLTTEALDMTLTRRDMVIEAHKETIAAQLRMIAMHDAQMADKDTIIQLLNAGAANGLIPQRTAA